MLLYIQLNLSSQPDYFFKGCHPFGMDLKYICFISHISTYISLVWALQQTELSTISNIQMFFLRFDFWASQYIIRLESQSICLDDSRTPLSNVNVRRASPNFCSLSACLSPTTRLPPIAGSQTLAGAIVSLYYLYNTLSDDIPAVRHANSGINSL